MLSRFERAMASVSIMLVKARAPSDEQHPQGGDATAGHAPRTGAHSAAAAKVGQQAAAPTRRFRGFTDLRTTEPPILVRTWRQLGDWLGGGHPN